MAGHRPLLIYYHIRSYWNMQESDAIIKVSYTVLESSGIIVILRHPYKVKGGRDEWTGRFNMVHRILNATSFFTKFTVP